MPRSIPNLPASGNDRSLARGQTGGSARFWPAGPIAFTLLEVVIVVAIVFILAYLTVPTAMHAAYRSQVTRAVNDIEAIGSDIDVFELQTGTVPDDLSVINRAGMKDPWGRAYVYLSFAAVGPSWKGKARKDHSLVPINSRYDLYSLGKDGKSSSPLTAAASKDDIVRANDGGFVGLGADY
jgi:general secretion pathway protein G